ncbi:MAG: hypothetical protein QM791_02010 [Ferruginibacter sp.]
MPQTVYNEISRRTAIVVAVAALIIVSLLYADNSLVSGKAEPLVIAYKRFEKSGGRHVTSITPYLFYF